MHRTPSRHSNSPRLRKMEGAKHVVPSFFCLLSCRHLLSSCNSSHVSIFNLKPLLLAFFGIFCLVLHISQALSLIILLPDVRAVRVSIDALLSGITHILTSLHAWGGTMPLKEVDANTLAGRESRASSNITTNQHDRKNSQQNHADIMSSGVMSMLRTTTDFGDLDSIAPKPKRTRPGRRLSINAPPLSRTSSHYSQFSRAESVRSRTSNHSAREPSIPGAWPTPGLQPPGFDTR